MEAREGDVGVAHLAEGVDRNTDAQSMEFDCEQSPSSRRAWIEILLLATAKLLQLPSPSSRRAWIEIPSSWSPCGGRWVALLAEGVDRNWITLSIS